MITYVKKWKENTNEPLEPMCRCGQVFGNRSIHKNQLYFPKPGTLENSIFPWTVIRYQWVIDYEFTCLARLSSLTRIPRKLESKTFLMSFKIHSWEHPKLRVNVWLSTQMGLCRGRIRNTWAPREPPPRAGAQRPAGAGVTSLFPDLCPASSTEAAWHPPRRWRAHRGNRVAPWSARPLAGPAARNSPPHRRPRRVRRSDREPSRTLGACAYLRTREHVLRGL